MRLIKMLGLAAMAAMVATAFVGASTAMAKEDTTLCTVHEDPCAAENQLGLFTMLAENTVLLSSIATILCLHSVAWVKVEEPKLAKAPEPLRVEVEELDFLGCGTNAEHNNCEVTVESLPLFDVLKTALNLGTAEVLNAKVRVKCGFLVNCAYSKTEKPFSVEGAEHTEGAGEGMFTAENLEVAAGEGFACPSTANWHALYEPLPEKPIYVVS